MDRIVSLVGTESLTEAECYSYLGKEVGLELPLLFCELAKLELAVNLFSSLKSTGVEFFKLDILQLASGASSNVTDGENIVAKLIASRILLGVCTTSVSSAYGILTSNVLNQILDVVSKAAIDGIHDRSKLSASNSEVTNDESNGPTTRHMLTEADILSPLFQLLVDIYEAGSTFWHRTDEYLIDAFAEAMVAAVCLGSSKESFSECAQIAGATLGLFSCQSQACLMATYRALLPVITLAGRDLKLPDAGKHKVQCHVSASKILAAMMKSCRGVLAIWDSHAHRPPLSTKKSPKQKRATLNDSLISVTSPASSSKGDVATPMSPSQLPAQSLMAAPFTCAIGLIQRLLLTASERVIPRTTIIASASKMINALQNSEDDLRAIHELLTSGSTLKKPLKKRRSDSDNDQSGPNFVFPTPCDLLNYQQNRNFETELEQVTTAVSKALSFLVKLSMSSKLGHRLLSVDVGGSLLQENWLRDLCKISSEKFKAEMILEMVVDRCSDVAATVRSRSLGALWDLFNSLASAKDHAAHFDFIQLVHALLMGGRSLQGHCTVPLMDKLRDMACDNKPLVRVKAIQTLAFALTIEWPRMQHLESADMCDNVQLYLSDDDVAVIAERCSDQSISVRKQAVVSLSAILQCRPSDTSLQEAWIDAALPLIMDPESGVQSKVSQSVMDIILQGAVSDPSSSMNETTWSICNKISESECTKLLRTAVSQLKKSGMLSDKPEKEKSNGLVLMDVLSCVKQACCVSMADSESASLAEEGRTFLSQQSNEEEDIKTLRHQDYEVVSNGAWVLLEALTSIQDVTTGEEKAQSLSAEFVVKCWLHRHHSNMTSCDSAVLFFDELEIRMLRVMSKLSASVRVDSKRTVCKQLRKVLGTAMCAAQGVSAALNVLYSFSIEESVDIGVKNRHCLSDKSMTNILEFSGQLMNVANEILFNYLWGKEKHVDALYEGISYSVVSVSNNAEFDVLTQVSTALCCIGEISMLGFSVEEDEDSFSPRKMSSSSKLPQLVVSESSGTFKLLVPESLVTMVQMLMGHELPNRGNGPTDINASLVDKENLSSLTVDNNDSVVYSTSTSKNSTAIPNKIRAQAFIVMGKLCLRSRKRARDHVNVFLRELKHGNRRMAPSSEALSPSLLSTTGLSCQGADGGTHAVRSNSLIVLGDLCVRFTNLVDRHVGSMSSCLQDSNVMVRRHAFVLLTQLLLQEYIKWRGMLLFRFLAVVVDRNEEIAELSKYVLRHTLQSKYSGFMVQNFSEAIIVFNNCSGHATYRAMASIGADGGSCAVSMEGIDLSGPSKKSLRMEIYNFMMEDITEEEKIQITANVSQDILAYPLDFPIETSSVGGGALSPFESALEDAFAVLQSPLLRVGSKRGGASAHNDEEEDAVDNETAIANEARTALHKAKTKVLKKLSLQHLVDHMLPVVSSLKHFLENKRSPIQKSLMEYLMSLVTYHKNEVAMALSSDPGLKEEIEYDIKLFEREKNEESKRNKIYAAEKAVLNLEKSTTRKTSAANSSRRRSSIRSDTLADRLPGSMQGSAKSRRPSSKSTPVLHSMSKLSVRHSKSSPDFEDLTSRLGVEGRDELEASSPKYVSSAKKWSVSIGVLNNEEPPAHAGPKSQKKRARGVGREHMSVLSRVGMLGDKAMCGSPGEEIAPQRKKTKPPSDAPEVSGKRTTRSQKKNAGSDSLFALN